jgi:hypothetical protein
VGKEAPLSFYNMCIDGQTGGRMRLLDPSGAARLCLTLVQLAGAGRYQYHIKQSLRHTLAHRGAWGAASLR